ncbi:MAG: dihydroorotase [Lactovum sp.]
MLLKNALILDELGEKKKVDIEIQGQKIKRIESEIKQKADLDLKNKLLVPAFIDVHTHTRNPGQSYKETIQAITQAAIAGGYGMLCAMPNTSPVIDSPKKVKESLEKLNQTDLQFFQYGALSQDLISEKPADYQAMKEAGAIAFSNDGRGVQKTQSIYQMMTACRDYQMLYVSHSEVDDLLFSGVMHEGKRNKELGLPGILSSVESIAVAKEIMLATELACPYHICHLSSQMSVDLLRLHQSYGSQVSGEVSPHHLILSEEDIPSDDPNYKMNPPLRAKKDQESLIQGLNDGTIQIIATDHAPHHSKDKGNSFINAAFGIVGLETAFPLLYSQLVLTGKVKLKTIIDALTINPAQIFNLPAGRLAIGEIANLTLIDLDYQGQIDKEKFYSLGQNTPFHHYKINAKIENVILNGNIQIL